MISAPLRRRWLLSLSAVAVTAGLLFAPAKVVRTAERPDLSRLVVIGDSLFAGYQNDSLLAEQQVHNAASLVASQAGVSLPLPLIAFPGIPNVIVDVDPGPPPVITRAPGVSSGRLNPAEQAMNLAVPGHTVGDALALAPDLPIDSLTDLVLGIPGLFSGIARSQVEWAEALAPSTVLLWLGSNDALGAIVLATDTFATPPAAFAAAYASVISRLAATGASLVVLNVPDLTRVPYLTSAEALAAQIGLPLELIGPVLGIAAGDSITVDGLMLVPAVLADPLLGPLPPSVVLTAAEAAAIRATVNAYNAAISQLADQHGATFVDAHALFESLAARGRVAGGRLLTTAYFGGIFSLDGIHPTNTGHAIIANEIIKEMNRQTAAGIPPLSIAQVAASDPLVGPRFAPGRR